MLPASLTTPFQFSFTPQPIRKDINPPSPHTPTSPHVTHTPPASLLFSPAPSASGTQMTPATMRATVHVNNHNNVNVSSKAPSPSVSRQPTFRAVPNSPKGILKKKNKNI
jgi:hypothetical protein